MREIFKARYFSRFYYQINLDNYASYHDSLNNACSDSQLSL